MKLEVPPALKQEHDNLRANLAAAAKEPGSLGEAARELARVLDPHFATEEELVYPPLGMLSAAAEGRITDDMVEVLSRTRRLKEALPDMLAAHRKIQDGLDKLRTAAAAASRPTYERFADALDDHIDMEEEVLYLAAILVGEHVALSLEQHREKTPPPWRSRRVP
jgi:hemerythrin superfamily protein